MGVTGGRRDRRRSSAGSVLVSVVVSVGMPKLNSQQLLWSLSLHPDPVVYMGYAASRQTLSAVGCRLPGQGEPSMGVYQHWQE